MTPSYVPRLRSAALLAALALGLPAAAAAQDAEPSPTAEYRVALMEALRAHTGAMRSVLNDGAPFEASLPAHATAVHQIAAILEAAFPAGSGGEATRAKDEIWTDGDAFHERMAAFGSAAAALETAAASGDAAATSAALQAVGQSCTGCHRDFRKPAS